MTDDLPDAVLERAAGEIHAYCCRNMIMTYLDADEDCLGIARAVAPMLIAHGRELEKAEIARNWTALFSIGSTIVRPVE